MRVQPALSGAGARKPLSPIKGLFGVAKLRLAARGPARLAPLPYQKGLRGMFAAAKLRLAAQAPSS